MHLYLLYGLETTVHITAGGTTLQHTATNMEDNGSVTRCPHSDLPAGKGEGLRAAGTGNDMELHCCTYTCTVYRDDDNQLLIGNSDKNQPM